MDSNDPREALGQGQMSGVVVGADWRTELQPGSRQMNVNRIMETLRMNLPFSGQKGLQDVENIALRFEESIYTAATSQSDYMTKIWLKLVAIETKFKNPMANSPQSDAANLQQMANALTREAQQTIQSTGPVFRQQITFDQQKQLLRSSNIMPEVPLNSSSQIGSATSGDWQEEIYQKIKSMYKMYYPELNERNQEMAAKLREPDDHPQQITYEEHEILRFRKLILECCIIILQTNKSDIKLDHKAKIVGVENQIVNILNSCGHRKSVSSLQQGQLTQPHMHAMQQSQQLQPQMPSNIGQMNYQMQPVIHGSILPAHPKKGQMNYQMQPVNIPGPILPAHLKKGQMNYQMQPVNNTLYSGPRVLNPRQYVLGALQHNALNQMQQLGLQQQTDILTSSLGSSSRMGSATSGDWQEEVHQKIKSMHEKYYTELNEMYLRMHNRRPQQPKSSAPEKLRFLMHELEGVIMFLQTNKDAIQPIHKDMIVLIEKKILYLLNINWLLSW